jgi:hypothetical protein
MGAKVNIIGRVERKKIGLFKENNGNGRALKSQEE